MILLSMMGNRKPKFTNHFVETKADFDHLMSIERRLKKENLLSKHDQNYFISDENPFKWGDRYFDHYPFYSKLVPTLHLVDDRLLTGGLRVALDDAAMSNMNAIICVFLAEYLCQ